MVALQVGVINVKDAWMEKVLTTRSNKDYLKAIYKVKKKHGGCRNILLANEMGVSKASVSVAVKKLEQEGLVSRDFWGINLTNAGEQIAERLYAKEMFFIQWFAEIGINEETARADACTMEYAISEETFEKIRDYLESCRLLVQTQTE